MTITTTSRSSTRPVAITGATGFVGSHLAAALRTQGYSVTAVVRPTSQTERLKALGVDRRVASLDDSESLTLALNGCETLYHLAGAVDFQGDWRRFHQVNVEGTENVLRAAQCAGVRRVVMTSSIVAVAASRTPSPFDESATWNLGPYRIPYVTTKRQAEELALGKRFGDLEVVVVNPSCVIGPGDTGSEFGVLMHRFWRGRVPFFFGGGSNFVDVRDVADGLIAAAQRGRPGERYLLTGANHTWNDFFLALSRAAQRTIPRMRLPSMIGEWFAAVESRCRGRKTSRPNLTPDQAKLMPLYFFFAADKAKHELGFQARPLRETLADAHAAWIARRSSVV